MRSALSIVVVSLASLAPLAAHGDAGAPAGDHVWASCTEHVPSGIDKPKLVERFAARGLSGYALPLEISLEHGKGEVVLPEGLSVQSGGDAARALAEAGFYLPDPDGGAGPHVVKSDLSATRSRTDVTISVVALPKTPGRQTMTLPPVPIAVARASGEVVTLCTAAHAIRIEDPTSSVAEPTPRPNPAARVQREEWVLAKQITVAALTAAALAVLLTFLVMKWLRRPRPAKPPPPPRPPWEVAWEELRAVRFAGLVEQGRYAEHFDRVSDALRKYLGGLYGFDGLETTTFEMELILRGITSGIAELGAIGNFLERCDLVKFARFAPSQDDCARVTDEAERLVNATMPASRPVKEAG